MFSVEMHVGRLIEIVMSSPLPLPEVEGLIRDVRMNVMAASEPVLICVRMERLRVMLPEATEPLLGMLRRDNPKVVRSGYLLAQRYGSLAMQVDRIVREANNPNRRWFTQLDELRTFIDEVARPDESARLAAFLAPTSR